MLPAASGLTINPTPYTSGPVTLVGTEDNVLIFDVSSAAITVNLPSSASFPGLIYWLEVLDTTGSFYNFLTVQADGSDNIQTGIGVSNYVVINVQACPLGLISDGMGNWYFLSSTFLSLAYNNLNSVMTVDSYGNPNYVPQLTVPLGGTGLATLTAHDLLVGADAGNVTLVAPSATAGVPLVSAGASTDPAYGTAVVAGGGTGQTSLTVHGVVVGNATSGVNVTSAGAVGTVLTGNGASDPTFQAPTALANTMSVTVTETIAAGAMINLWASTGLKVRNADNTDATKQADGFALTGASSGAITVVIGSAPNTQQTSLTVGTRYFLGTAGAVTATAPSSSGDLVQSLGIAVTTTELQVIIGNVTTIA